MGMTIDEHIVQIKKFKSFHNGSYGASINYAIDIMRKYQKIQEIVEDRNSKPPLTTLNEIIMVVEEWAYYKKKARENKDEV